MKIAVGLSGGVDSSVAALMLKEQGHEVVGVTMKLWRGTYRGGDKRACYGPCESQNIERARAIAQELGIGYQVFDCSEAYERAVVDYFRETSLAGCTPNPCVMCNAAMKFGLLPKLCREGGFGFDRFATGHYARIIKVGDRFAVQRAADEKKDQSYFLYRLTQDQLASALFPLGAMTKVEVRTLAGKYGLTTAERADSQDFYTGDKNELIGAEPRTGEIVDLEGRVLGHHEGFWNFTIGQRKGFGFSLGHETHYVIKLDAEKNQVVVGVRSQAFMPEFRVGDMHWMAHAPTEEPFMAYVKVRSTGVPMGPVTFENGVCRAEGDGIFGVAPGQSAVFYDGNGIIQCGGVIQ